MKKICYSLIGTLLVLLLCSIGFFATILLTEYKPDSVSPAQTSPIQPSESSTVLSLQTPVTVMSWNTGYAGLDSDTDFFMDGGQMVSPVSQKHVLSNMSAISETIQNNPCNIYFLQEVDRKSSRTKKEDELQYYAAQTGLSWSYAPNYRCIFVPYPWPPIGSIDSGIATLTNLTPSEVPLRISLPCPFKLPKRAANLKRCLLINRYPIKDSTKELVAINLHLEAYDDGDGKTEQTKVLLELLDAEYQKGNYVIAGGDFNQSFPGSTKTYPIKNPKLWTPGILSESGFSKDWKLGYDLNTPTCRLLNQPYDPNSHETQYYTIDGFILSPNINIDSVTVLNLNFANSDHNPVLLTASFK